MLIEYAVFLLLGIAAGVAAGLLPGLHVNNIGTIMLGAYASLGMDPLSFTVFLTSMCTAQAFTGFIPSIFLGVPEEGTVLSLLPAHRLVLEGRGMEAVRITGLACLQGTLLSLAMLPMAFLLVPALFSLVKPAVAPIIIFAVSCLILRERGENKLWASASFLISGYLGWTCLNLEAVSTSDVFLPLFSGLFGLGTLLTGMAAKSKSYPQDPNARICTGGKMMWRSSMLGSFGGLLVGLLPAMSPSQIGIFFQELGGAWRRVSSKFGRRRRSGAMPSEGAQMRSFLAMIASLGAADAMFSIFALYLIGNPRSGISVVMQDLFGSIDAGLLAAICCVMAVSAALSYRIHLWLGARFSSLAGRLDMRMLSAAGFVFVVALVFASTGLFGLLIAAVSTCAGLIPALTGVSRTHCMGCLLLPTLMISLGIS